MLETLDYIIRIGSTPTFLYFDLYLYSAYASTLRLLGIITLRSIKKRLSFHIHACLREHEEIYGTVINRIDKDNFPMELSHIYTEMNPNNFGRIIVYLTLVYKIVDFLEVEIVREAVRKTIQDLILKTYRSGKI